MDGAGVERSGGCASEADGALGDAIEGSDVGRREEPDEQMVVPSGGDAHGVDALGCGVRRLRGGLRGALGGGHVDLLPADGVPGGRGDGGHAGDFGDELGEVGEEVFGVGLLVGGEAGDVELGEEDGGGGGFGEEIGAQAAGGGGEDGIGGSGDAEKGEMAVLEGFGGRGGGEIGGVAEAEVQVVAVPLGEGLRVGGGDEEAGSEEEKRLHGFHGFAECWWLDADLRHGRLQISVW